MLIDLYCERTAAGFWNEPLNALSNAGFLLAAVLAWQSRRQRGSGDLWEALVILLAGLIGVGSFLFHTFANSWSELADVVPIWSFVAAYVVLTIYQKARKASSFRAEMDSEDGKAVLMDCKMHNYFIAVYIASFVMA